MKIRYPRRIIGWVAACAALMLPNMLAAQQINLDRPVRAGELVVFPDIQDENAFYYVVDQPQLANDENGRPQFSFLRYVENVRSGANDAEAREGEGGGIVHCVVSLAVTPDQLREAQQELRRVESGGEIRGPVVFKSGRFGLVSSFTDTEGNLSTQVVGLGNAPLLDGQKAAVSMQLTKLGAKILWESFQTPTPDISFTFEMEVEGFRSPKRALIEAEFDQIYEHEAFGIGIQSEYLAGEIKGAFDDLQRSGAIKVTQVGEDAKMDELITTAYNKLTEMMFSPMGGSGTPSLSSLTATGGGGPSLLDRASSMYTANQQRADQQNVGIRRQNAAAQQRADAENRRRRADASAAGSQGASGGGSTPTEATPTETTPQAESADADEATDETEAAGADGDTEESSDDEDGPGRFSEEEPVQVGEYTQERDPGIAAEEVTPETQEEVSPPPFAVVAAFEMKRVRQRGTFTIDLNKFTSDSITLRFDENIGDLRRLMDQGEHFRSVNLDDPLYRQREIVAMVDGYNASDFGEFINYVTVLMRKRHEAGEETYDEVRIDRKNFSSEGNAFKLLYGWKDDEDRRRWMEYDLQTKWSFFGGAEVETAWAPSTSGAVSLAPPFQRRTVTLEADPDILGEAQVRTITVKIFYDIGAGEQVKQVTLSPSKDLLSDTVDFILPADSFDYEYEITWRLRGNQTVESGRQSASDAILFVDELPEA